MNEYGILSVERSYEDNKLGTKGILKRVRRVLGYWAARTPSVLREVYKVDKMLAKSSSYVVKGTAKDNAWLYKNREMIEQYAYDEMRNEGFVPIMDISSGLNISFDEQNQCFNYEIKIPGYYLGATAKDYMGILATEGIIVNNGAEAVSLLALK